MHSVQQHLRVANVMDNGTTIASSEGHTPASYEQRANRFLTRFCSYRPAMIECGDILEVSSSNPEVSFVSPAGSELQCYWLIKAPEGERLQLDFTSFNVAGTPGKCQDELEVRYSRPGQPGRIYCGSSWEKSTISINNTVHIRLSTYGDTASQFSATVKLIQDSELCYNADDRGMTYAGDVNVTRDFQPCLPWHEMTHCLHHPFNTDIFNTILMGNECRNPDPARGFQPWCYTDKSQCQRNYCDVCQLGKHYDSRGDCADLKSRGICDMSVCGKTCTGQLSSPAPAHQVSCPTPEAAPDGVVADPKASYAVGEAATYRCKHNNSTKDRLCLSTGQWSAMGQVCSVCLSGWHKNAATQSCYSPVFSASFFAEAQATCQEYNAIVSTAKTEEENTFMQNLARSDLWLGVTDIEVEGTWIWEDGDQANFTSWGRGEPNDWGPGEDCVVTNSRGSWNDLPCTGYARSFVCKSSITALQTCLDFSDKCSELFQLKPSMCTDFPKFAEEQCKYTCGLCLLDHSPKCPVGHVNPNVITTETRSELPRGSSITYSCNEAYVQVSGNDVRGCDESGILTGSPLRCADDCPVGWTFLEDELACYKFFDTREAYAAAGASCAAYGAVLATSKSSAENDLLRSLRTSDAWIGLDDSNSENDFVWSDGLPLTLARWRSGEPNDWGSGEDCTVMRHDGSWDDRACYRAYTYLCKMPHPALTATTPTTEQTTPTPPTPSTPATPTTSNPATPTPSTPATPNTPTPSIPATQSPSTSATQTTQSPSTPAPPATPTPSTPATPTPTTPSRPATTPRKSTMWPSSPMTTKGTTTDACEE
ncbi:hypothetical protein RRG08_021952 [Elysia crispata]|uniref:Uncharacterized protein n=1 Tax=Elysia crispata TaxID=231223 RepID=A0AAE1ACN3_9GAST|nr:hypothetical protein RRG08_021952 [Elysia crispata]